MNLLPNIRINIDIFVGRNINNYDNMRSCFMTSNKNTSRTVLMFLSETLVDYVTRMKQLNNISDKDKTRDLIDNL